ncbi:MAG: ribonuclease PH, partial [Tepidanaerobacteraceae bacterium]
LDCDVIQADGGTRTLSITGAFIALADAIKFLKENNLIETNPINNFVAAISAGIVDGERLLDLVFEEDCRAQVDMNVVMTDTGQIVEIQGTGEAFPFSREELDGLMDLAFKGISELIQIQKKLIIDI